MIDKVKELAKKISDSTKMPVEAVYIVGAFVLIVLLSKIFNF